MHDKVLRGFWYTIPGTACYKTVQKEPADYHNNLPHHFEHESAVIYSLLAETNFFLRDINLLVHALGISEAQGPLQYATYASEQSLVTYVSASRNRVCRNYLIL